MAQKQVAIFVDMISSFGRNMIRGIARYTQTHEQWALWGGPERIAAPIDDLRRWRGDGIIAQVWEQPFRDLLITMNVPFVNVSDHLPGRLRCSVLADSRHIGAMAAEHFLERGFRSFGYCGFEDHHYSQSRRQSFIAALQQAGYTCSVYDRGAPQLDLQRWTAFQAEMANWLTSLPRPTAIFCCNDVRARHVAHISRNIGIRIPEDIALLGVDNDELLCEMSDPPLSSIDPSAELVGFEAARLLDGLMNGAAPPPEDQPLFIAPAGVIRRRSSDILAIEDSIVAEAVRFIHDNVRKGPVTVDSVASAVPLSRRALERRFRVALGRTIGQEIDHACIAQAKRLLVDSDARISDIAHRSGFAHVQQLNRLFKAMTGVTPVQYRRKLRPH